MQRVSWHRLRCRQGRFHCGLVRPPLFPADLFAAAGHLLGPQEHTNTSSRHLARRSSVVEYGGPTKAPSQKTIERWAKIGRRWATGYRMPSRSRSLQSGSGSSGIGTPSLSLHRGRRLPGLVGNSSLSVGDCRRSERGLGYQFADDPANPVAQLGELRDRATVECRSQALANHFLPPPFRGLAATLGDTSRSIAWRLRQPRCCSRAAERSERPHSVAPFGHSHNLALMPAHGRSQLLLAPTSHRC